MSEYWKSLPIHDLVERIETRDPRKVPDEPFTYIDVSSVSRATMSVTETSSIMGAKASSRARRLVREGDVIFATIRPTLKRIAQIPSELDGAICSTGFFVLRPKDEVSGRYLFYWLFGEQFSKAMEKLQRGAAYPAVSDSDVKRQYVHLPPLPEQKRIVAILDEAFAGIDAAIANTEKNLANARELRQSAISKVIFEDAEKAGSRSKKVSELALPEKGSMRTGPFGSQLRHGEFVDRGIPVLGIDNVVNNEFEWGKKRHITKEKYQEITRYTVKPGDVLITIMGTCGRCAVVPEDIPTAINSKHLCCISLDKDVCLPEFLHAYFLYHPVAREFLESQAKGSIMAGLNMGIIKELPVRLPDLEEQQRVIARVEELNAELMRLLSVYEQKKFCLSELKQSLLQKAFSGELTAETAEKEVDEAVA